MAFLDPIQQVYLTVKALFSGLLGNVIVAIVVLLLGFILGRIIGRVSKMFFHEIELDTMARKAAGIRFSVEDILAHSISGILYVITVILALNRLCFGTRICLGNTLAYVLVAGVVLFLILSIFLTVKKLAPNVIAWLHLAQKRKLRVGDRVRYRDIEGEILQLGLFELKIRSLNGDLLFIPNANFMRDPLLKKPVSKNGVKKK